MQKSSSISDEPKPAFMVVPVDNRIMYCDDVSISTNDYGVVFDFMQQGGDQKTSVARVGMSKDHLKHMISLLETSLNQSTKPRVIRALPQPKMTTDETNKHL